jgi:hypothetical protein
MELKDAFGKIIFGKAIEGIAKHLKEATPPPR